MATWHVIEYAGQTLVGILQRHFAILLAGSGSTITVQLASAASFEQYARPSQPTITLFLYRVQENVEMRNAPQRARAGGQISRQPLPLELCYMVTAWGVRTQDSGDVDRAASAEEHRLLGAVLQAFYDHGEVARPELFDTGPTDAVWAPPDSLQIVLESPPVDEIFRIWDSTEMSFRTSLCYRVRVLGLDPIESVVPARVLDSEFTAGNI